MPAAAHCTGLSEGGCETVESLPDEVMSDKPPRPLNFRLNSFAPAIYSAFSSAIALESPLGEHGEGHEMTDDELIRAVNEVFIDSFEIPPEKLTPQALIFQDLGLDSLDVVDLVAAIQKRFKVQVRDDERVRSIRSMQDLYNYLILIRGEQKLG
jgi:acyl carrier protein